MGGYRALVERKPFNGDFFVALIDHVLLPALRGASATGRGGGSGARGMTLAQQLPPPA